MFAALRRPHAAVLIAAGSLLTGCTGTSTGSPDPGAVDRTIGGGADAATPWIVTYAKPIAAVVLVIVVVGIVQTLWRNMMIRLVGACIIAAFIAWQLAKSTG